MKPETGAWGLRGRGYTSLWNKLYWGLDLRYTMATWLVRLSRGELGDGDCLPDERKNNTQKRGVGFKWGYLGYGCL